ncbi:MAG TPA: hypothetical protein VNT79_18160 [Phycisphaerae bacterium]|nr:hypothetical protein [Phycisphaerae bacterium]
MTDKEAVIAIIRALESASISYMVVGSLSSNVYGIPRSTQDADFVIELGNVSLAEFKKRLPDGLEIDPQMSFETVTCTHRYIVKLKGSHFKVELFLLSDDAHDRERFRRRLRRESLGQSIWLPTAEDVIITKLHWSKQGRRKKDIDDVLNVISVQRDRIDWPYVHRWCDEHGTRELLESVKASIPPIS